MHNVCSIYAEIGKYKIPIVEQKFLESYEVKRAAKDILNFILCSISQRYKFVLRIEFS